MTVRLNAQTVARLFKLEPQGSAGFKNLDTHRASKACRQARAEGTKGAVLKKPPKQNQVLDAFFKPRVPLDPSTVSAPLPICPDDASISAPECSALGQTGRSKMGQQLAQPGAHHITAEKQTSSVKICQKGVSLLQDLEGAVSGISSDTPNATPEHRLSVFAVEPRTCVAEPGEDDWLILNQMMKSTFGWGETEMAAAVPQLLNRGEYGLDGFICFMTFFVHERGLEGALFEIKDEALLRGLRDQ